MWLRIVLSNANFAIVFTTVSKCLIYFFINSSLVTYFLVFKRNMFCFLFGTLHAVIVFGCRVHNVLGTGFVLVLLLVNLYTACLLFTTTFAND